MKLKDIIQDPAKYTLKQLNNIVWLVKQFKRERFGNKKRWAWAFQLQRAGVEYGLDEQRELMRQDIEDKGFRWGEPKERSEPVAEANI